MALEGDRARRARLVARVICHRRPVAPVVIGPLRRNGRTDGLLLVRLSTVFNRLVDLRNCRADQVEKLCCNRECVQHGLLLESALAQFLGHRNGLSCEDFLFSSAARRMTSSPMRMGLTSFGRDTLPPDPR